MKKEFRNNFILPAAITVSLVVITFVYIKQEADLTKQEINYDLGIVARMSARQVSDWYLDEINDIQLIASNQLFRDILRRALIVNTSSEKDNLLVFLENFRTEHDYKQISVYNTDLELILSTGLFDKTGIYDIVQNIKEAKKKQGLVTTGFYKNKNDSCLQISFAIPVRQFNSGKVISYISFTQDTERNIFSLNSAMELRWYSFETELLASSGAEKIIIYNQDKVARKENISEILLANSPTIERQAILGVKGPVWGKDYLGEEVWAYVCPLLGTPWCMVAKVNDKEVMQSQKRKLLIVVLFSVLLILLSISGMALLNNTRQKKIYQRLYSKEKEYSTTLYSIGDAVITTDKDCRITLMNPVAEQITGWKEDEVRGELLQNVFRIINARTREKADNPVEQVLENAEIVGLANHTLLISKNGLEFQISDSAAPIKNEKDEILGVVLVFRDVTQEYNLRAALQISEERLHVASDSLDGILYVLDNELRFIVSKGNKLNVIGLRPDEVVGRTLYDYYHTTNKKHPSIEKHLKVLAGEKITIETQHGEVFFSTKLSPVKDPCNKIVGIIGLTTDISEQKKAMKHLRASEEKFRALFEDHTAVHLLIEHKTGRIINANRAAEIFYGWTIEELKHMSIFDINTLPQQEVKQEIDKANVSKKFYFEFKHRLSDGSIRDVEIYSNRIELSGKAFLHSIVHDVTDKKKLMSDLIVAKEKAEESNKLKSAFLANMSHEIRTPLNGILGFTGLLTGDISPSPSKRKEYADIIHHSAQNLMKIINDILDISKIDAGQFQIEYKSVDLRELLKSLEILYKRKIDEKHKRNLKLQLQKLSKSLWMETDETRLIQILGNLLDNAVKFTDEGTVSFGISNISESKIEFFVSDTGIGIPESKQKIIFDRFTQANEHISEIYGGTGLGLSIVKQIIHLMHGEIRFESQVEKGTTFWFHLPFSKKTGMAQDTFEYRPESLDNLDMPLKILLVEDDPVSRFYYQEILKESKVELLISENGQQALQILKNYTPDVILMDIRLPDINGLEVVKEFRKRNKFTYIIAQSAYAMSSDKKASLEAGCNDFITKPLNANEIYEKLNRIKKYIV